MIKKQDYLLTQEKIVIGQKCSGWKDAIFQAAEPLISQGSILRNHVNEMIKVVEEYGPYILITPNVAIAHAAPSSDVLKNDLSLLILKQGVDFGSLNDPAKLVFCLSVVDHESHIELLSQLAILLQERNVIEELIQCKNPSEAGKICKKYLRKEES
jgi:PTS system ascorbate-specific IIA component